MSLKYHYKHFTYYMSFREMWLHKTLTFFKNILNGYFCNCPWYPLFLAVLSKIVNQKSLDHKKDNEYLYIFYIFKGWTLFFNINEQSFSSHFYSIYNLEITSIKKPPPRHKLNSINCNKKTELLTWKKKASNFQHLC